MIDFNDIVGAQGIDVVCGDFNVSVVVIWVEIGGGIIVECEGDCWVDGESGVG